jgi:hypothetical protein
MRIMEDYEDYGGLYGLWRIMRIIWIMEDYRGLWKLLLVAGCPRYRKLSVSGPVAG